MKLKFFNLCKKLSMFSNHDQHRLGCVIVQKNRVVARGYNQIKTHTDSPHPYRMLHAELHALIGSQLKNVEGAVAYVYRETKDGTPAKARPCYICWEALKQAGIVKVFYSCNNGYQEETI